MTGSTKSTGSTARPASTDVAGPSQWLDAATVMLTAEFDDDGPRIAFADKAFCHLTGFAWEAIDGAALNGILVRRMAASELRTLQGALSSGGTWECLVTVRCANGTELTCTFEARPLAAITAHRMLFAAEFRDLLGRRRLSACLEDLETRLDLVQGIQAVGSWSAVLAEPLRIQISLELMRMLELTEEDLVADPDAFFSRIHAGDRERLTQVLRRGLIEQQGFDWQHRVVLPGSAIRWVRMRGTVVAASAAGPARMIGIVLDITERIQAREVLSAVERRYLATTEAIRDALFTLEAPPSATRDDFAISDLNPQAAELFGSTRQELLGRCVRDFAPALHESGFTAKCLNAMQSGTPYQETTPGSALGFGPKWLRWRIVPLSGGVVVSAVDVSWEQELSTQLAHKSRLESIGSLAVGVAHDFNNMLTAIAGFSELARDTLVQHAPARFDIEQVIRATERATQLTRYLLAFGSRQPLEPQRVDLCALVRDLAPILVRLTGPSVAIVFDLAPTLSTWLDPSLFEQAIVNLVVNAKDAMSEGGTLRVVARIEQLDAGHRACHHGCISGEFVHLSVIDTGVGMSEMTRARVFEPFFTTKADRGGTGLGLASVYGFVKQSGGTVIVDSAVHVGTTMHLYFPVVGSGRRTSSAPEACVSHSRLKRSVTVLVVDSDEAVRTIARRLLQMNGYIVLEAAGAADAEALFSTGELAVDVLLTAMRLPFVGGVNLARLARQRHPRMRVILMSGAAETSELDGATAELGALYVQKPFTLSSLMTRVEEALAQQDADLRDSSHEN